MGVEPNSTGSDWSALRVRVESALGAVTSALDRPCRLKLVLRTNTDTVSLEAASPGAQEAAIPETVVSVALADLMAVLSGQSTLEQAFSQAKIQVEGDFKLALALARMLENKSHGATTVSPSARYASRRRPSESLAASQPPLTSVDRLLRPSVAEFRDGYLALGKPLVITGAIGHWRLAQASWEDLREAFAGTQGVLRRGDYISAAFSPDRDVAPTLIANFIDQLSSGGGESNSQPVPPYLGNNPCPVSMGDWFEFPEYFSAREYAPDMPRLWLGPTGTVTPLHRDSADNLFVQLRGRKSFLLGSPDQWPNFYPWATTLGAGLEGCAVDPESPDLKRHPLFAAATLLRVELGPSEMLFIPEGWFHHVRALEPQLSLSFWTRTARTESDVRNPKTAEVTRSTAGTQA